MKTLRQEIEALIEYYTESPIYYGVIVANRLTDILSRHTEPEPTAPVQDWAFILANAIKHLKEEEIAGLCFDLYCRSSLQELIDVKINTHKAQQPNGTIADAQAVHEYGTQPTAPSQRERIATAIMLELIRNSSNPEWTYAMLAEPSVTAADALIAELNKNEKSKELNSSDTKSRFDSDLFISNVCSSYRHDFGLMTEDDQQKLCFECKEWMRAIQNNWDHFKY